MTMIDYTYGAVDPLADAPRYTTLDLVKERLGIPAADTTRDAEITQNIIAAEYALDVSLGRSFPDPGTESFAGPYQLTVDPGIPAGAGNINQPAAGLEVAKVDFAATDHSGATLPAEGRILLERENITEALLAVSGPIVDNTTSWTMPYTVVSGAIPAQGPINFALLEYADGIGPVRGIPEAMGTAALQTSIAVYKMADAPFGVGGGDEFFGAVDVTSLARQAVTRNPTLMGFKIGASFGVA